jgi:two-component system phosphate regulon sensor histidine kinase PhoR
MEIALGLAVAAALAWAVVASVRARAARRGLADARRRARDAESARESAEVRQERMLDALSSVALRVDADARIAQVGRHAGERFDFLVPGLGLLEAFSEHRLARRVEQALTTLEPQHFEVRLFADGRRTFRVVVEPYAVDEGREALVLLADVSEAVAYQELRSQFVANVSHELRTPLTGLRGLLEALDDPAIDPVTRANFVARCISETQRLEALITDILFLSELEATHGLPPEEACDLVEAVEETAAELAEPAAVQGVTIEVTAAGPARCPLSDRMARTVARNLLENAIKYAGPGAVARATVAADAGEVTLVVADDGAGIPERHLPHIFERFYRADPSRSKRMGGTGLGLSIVKHIAERFGGRVSATSREGFGTTVTVALPAPAAAGAPEDGPGPREESL